MKKIFFITFALLCVVIACTRKANPTKTDGAKADTPKQEEQKTDSKDEQITYTMHIRPLIQSKCTPCHIPNKGGFKTALDTYSESKNYIDDIITRVQLSQGHPKYMPFKKQPLETYEIALLKKWKEQGLRN